MVEKKDAGPKKRKRRKAKVKPRAGQIITQKVVVNVGKSVPKRKRGGTQAKRSVQPQQVVYQNAPIPLQPNYSTEINDLRNEVRASRIASIVQPQQRTNPLAPQVRVPEKVPVKKERKILVDEDMPFEVPLEEKRPPISILRKTLDEFRALREQRTTDVAEGRLGKRGRGRPPGSKNKVKTNPLEAETKTTPEALSPAEDKDTPSTSPGLLDIPPDFGAGKTLNEELKRQTSVEIQEGKPKPGRPPGSRNKEKSQEEMAADFLKLPGATEFFGGRTPTPFKPAGGFNVPAMARSASSEMIDDERFVSAEGPPIV